MQNFVTDKEIAAVLSIHRSTVWRYVKLGILPEPVRIGRATRWRQSDVNAALERLSATPANGA